MPVDLAELRRRGVHSDNYRKIFSMEPVKYPKQIRKLVDLISARNKDGIGLCLKEYKAYAAIDTAYGVSFNQTTPTLVRSIMSKGLDQAGTIEALKDWGLTEQELFLKVKGSNGETQLVPNAPLFFVFLVPLVKSYLQTVLGQIYNERNTSPLLVYKPLKQTTRNRVLCGMLTDIMETISTNYGYPAVLRQAIHQMLKYGVMIAFPREEWDCQQQIIDGQKVTIKEGIRPTIPHPSRMAYDLKHPLTSLNTDTGCEWILNWDILSSGAVLDNRDYWNRKSIFAGTNWFLYPGAKQYFDEVFPCQMSFHRSAEFTSPMTRTDRAAYYSTGNRDQAVFVSNMFMKIIPSAFGLGLYNAAGKMVKSYDHPVWHRFVMASDDTVCWANPCAYNPGWFMGYDYDENADANPSLALDLIPFQDHLGNIISQMILTSKQNLMNCTFYDTNMVDKGDVERMLNSGERMYRSVNMIAFDSAMRARGQLNQSAAFIPMKFDKQSIVEMLQLIPVVLNILERVLSITAQETGGSATHQQSKEEVVRTGGASKSRRTLTAASVDEGQDAWMRQLRDGFAAYGDAKIVVQVDAEIEDVEKHIAELGFKIRGKGDDKILVEGNKSALKLEGFARRNDGPERPNEKEIAQTMMQVVGTISGQDDLKKEVGAKNLLKLIEQAAILAGAPADFKLTLAKDKGGQPSIPPELQQALTALSQQILKTVEEKMIAPAAQHAHETDQKLAGQEQIIKKLEGIFAIAAKTQDANEIKAKEAEAKIQIRSAEAKAEEQRKAEAHALKMQQEIEAAKVAERIALEKAEADKELARKKAESDAHLTEQKTRHSIAMEGARGAVQAHIAHKSAKAKPKADK